MHFFLEPQKFQYETLTKLISSSLQLTSSVLCLDTLGTFSFHPLQKKIQLRKSVWDSSATFNVLYSQIKQCCRKMPPHINQIICAGKIIYKTDPKNITWTKNRFKILNNSITVMWFNYNFHICKNIKILFKNNLHNIIKKEIQWFTGESVKKIRSESHQHSTQWELKLQQN